MVQYMGPLISVIIPVYNVEKYLDKCMDSIMNQTYTNLEIILVDDGSTDESGQKCDGYAIKDDRIKVIHKQNGGLSSARNEALDIMTGSFLTFVDSDDYIDSCMVEKLTDYAVKNNCDIVMGGHVKIVEETKGERNDKYDECGQILEAREAILKLLYRAGVTGYAHGKLYHAKLFKEIRFPEGKLFEDTITVYKVMKISNRVGVLNCPLYYYRQRSGSIVNLKYTSARLDEVYHAKEILQDVKSEDELKNAAAAYLFFSLLDNYALVGEKNAEDKLFLEKSIKKYRKIILYNQHAGMSLRIMALVSYFPGLKFTQLLGKAYKYRNRKKWIKGASRCQGRI